MPTEVRILPSPFEMTIRASDTMTCGSSSGGRARAFQARGRGFDSRLPLRFSSSGAGAVLAWLRTLRSSDAPDPASHAAKPRGFSPSRRIHDRDEVRSPRAHVAQAAEHFLGKEEVTGSNPVVGSMTRSLQV